MTSRTIGYSAVMDVRGLSIGLNLPAGNELAKRMITVEKVGLSMLDRVGYLDLEGIIHNDAYRDTRV